MADELEKLAKAATPGPWVASGDTVYYDPAGVCLATSRAGTDPKFKVEDAAFIAAANPDTVLKLIAVVRAAGVYAFEGHHEGCPGSEDGNWNCPCGYLKVAQALAALEASDRG